jgi:hypothetical protein
MITLGYSLTDVIACREPLSFATTLFETHSDHPSLSRKLNGRLEAMRRTLIRRPWSQGAPGSYHAPSATRRFLSIFGVRQRGLQRIVAGARSQNRDAHVRILPPRAESLGEFRF